jgi:hypothetical protein
LIDHLADKSIALRFLHSEPARAPQVLLEKP